MNAEYDWLACQGYCGGGFLEQRVNESFPNSRNVQTYHHPNSGHGINFGVSTNLTYCLGRVLTHSLTAQRDRLVPSHYGFLEG
jgi:hypothetical protein